MSAYSVRAPLPKPWAVQIGRSLSERTPAIGGDVKAADMRASLIVQYNALKAVFGDYADEVILQALSEYKGMDKTTAGLVTGYMEAIQAGGDPFKLNQRKAAAEAATEDLSLWDRFSNWMSGDDTSEVLRRTVEEVKNADTPEALEAIKARRGEDMVKAAQRQLEQ